MTQIKIKLTGLLITIFMMSSAYADSSKTLIVGGYDYPPYMDSKTETGIYHDLMKEISRKTGIKFKWQYFPYARLNSLFEQGSVHIEVGSSPDWVANASVPGLFTQDFYTLEDIAVFHFDKTFKILKARDIQHRTIGVVRGYGFTQFDDMFNSGKSTRSDANDEAHLLSMLLHKRVEAIFINRDVYHHHVRNHPEYQNFESGDVVGSYDVGFRIHPSQSSLIPTLNQLITSMKNEGRIQYIVNEALKKK